VNQIVPLEATATSFGAFSFLPLYLSAMMVIEPSSSVRLVVGNHRQMSLNGSGDIAV
jgi:hypothetical protein